MRPLLGALALCMLAGTATAQDYMIQRSCTGDRNLCTLTFGRPSNTGIAKIIHLPDPENEADKAELAARIAEWERVCEPIVAPDRQGIPRYSYGAACPNGIIVGTGHRPR